MATKQTSKDAKPTKAKTTKTSTASKPAKATKSPRSRASEDDVGAEPTARPRRPTRPTLHSSHGTKPVAGRPGVAPRPRAPVAPEASHVPSAEEGHLVPPRPSRPARPSKPPAATQSSGAQLALAIAAAALDKKAMNVEIVDLAGKADYADYLVLMSGSSDRHVRALADAIEEALSQKKQRPLSVEGANTGNWVLLDFGDVVAHVFQQSVRALYDIEGLWLDASRVPLPG